MLKVEKTVLSFSSNCGRTCYDDDLGIEEVDRRARKMEMLDVTLQMMMSSPGPCTFLPFASLRHQNQDCTTTVVGDESKALPDGSKLIFASQFCL